MTTTKDRTQYYKNRYMEGQIQILSKKNKDLVDEVKKLKNYRREAKLYKHQNSLLTQKCSELGGSGEVEAPEINAIKDFISKKEYYEGCERNMLRLMKWFKNRRHLFSVDAYDLPVEKLQNDLKQGVKPILVTDV